MSDMESKMNVLEQMNQLLAEKEKIFREKEEELEERFQKLKEFETRLLAKGEELKVQMKQISADEERLEKREKELQEYANTLENTMQQVMADKLALETTQTKELVMEWENDKLDELTEVLGLEQIPEEGEASPIPAMYKKMEKAVKKKYPSWSILEMTEEHLCIEAGDKEIRIFENQPVSEVQVVQFVKNAKNNKQLNTKLVGISRVAPEWSIKCEDNQLVCTYRFSKTITEENVLGKVHDFIATHL